MYSTFVSQNIISLFVLGTKQLLFASNMNRLTYIGVYKLLKVSLIIKISL